MLGLEAETAGELRHGAPRRPDVTLDVFDPSSIGRALRRLDRPGSRCESRTWTPPAPSSRQRASTSTGRRSITGVCKHGVVQGSGRQRAHAASALSTYEPRRSARALPRAAAARRRSEERWRFTDLDGFDPDSFDGRRRERGRERAPVDARPRGGGRRARRRGRASRSSARRRASGSSRSTDASASRRARRRRRKFTAHNAALVGARPARPRAEGRRPRAAALRPHRERRRGRFALLAAARRRRAGRAASR